MSNSERIARAAAEAAAKAEEKATKPPAKPRTRKTAEPKAPPKLKIVWAVGEPGAPATKTYPYNERAAADAEAARIGKNCRVTPLKVPM